jgi:anti-sigma regulatory factor (Ser/Thr protein kinase)
MVRAIDHSSVAGAALLAEPFDDPLPPVPPHAHSLRFQAENLREVRRVVADEAALAGLSAARSADLVLAVNEIATNSLLHGGGCGTLWVWSEPEAVLCEVHDAGRIEDPLVGRRRPPPSSPGGRGLWLANQLCELVQVRTFATHSAVRMFMRRAPIA